MTLPRKYVTFKVEDWDNFEKYCRENAEITKFPEELTGCIVFRHQDLFAAPAFYEYAGQIRTAIELAREVLNTENPAEMLSDLNRLADYFVDEAIVAETHTKRKIPD